MTKEELLAKIATIKNATQKGENTALRVGGAMEDMVSFTDEQIEKLKANTDSDFLVIDADMSPLMTEFVENGIPEDGIEIPTTVFQSIFGMQPAELCEKVFSAKHNMIRMFGSIENTSEEGVSIIKLNTLSKVVGTKMTFNDTSLGYGYIASIPFRIDALEGAQGVIMIQYVPAMQVNYVNFLLEESIPPLVYKELDWDGTSSLDVDGLTIVNLNLPSSGSLLDFTQISNGENTMIFGDFGVSTNFHIRVKTTRGTTTFSEEGVYQFACIFGKVTISKIY